MKKALLCLCLVFVLAGCGTRQHNMIFENGDTSLPATAKYSVGSAQDVSGFVFSDDDEEVDIAESMKTALVDELSREGLYQEKGTDYAIDVTVRKYEPGNAFGRWLMPGVGSTVLEVSSQVRACESPVGHIETKNTVDAGGVYTVGAWKDVFNDAAEEIVKELKESMGLIAE
ncbi:DUF4410 domain-containing protein [Pseudodesulfovibrio indicus]|uniref:DUF4410 domain-containing protein n=1 Tax=Pseudodesulfovibrio indicus TaxID=1716143 RepID=UPI002930C5FD|nr:DUF4410 domain-containing protein [Pseudodesulfovibrio indicus]